MIGVSNLSHFASLRATQVNSLARIQSLNRLSSGLRISRGVDGPAALIASMSMDATLAALEAESYANQRAINIANTADAALGEIANLLGEAKSLVAANANDGGLSDEEIAANQMEIDSILSSVDRIGGSTRFNGSKLLDGTATLRASGVSLRIAAAGSNDIGRVTIDGTDYTLSDVRSGKSLDTTNGANVENAGAVIDAAIRQVATNRGRVGAFARNTLAPRLTQIAGQREHMLATVSLIRGTDYAAEVSSQFRLQMLQRSSVLVMRQSQGMHGRLLSILA